MLRAHRVFRPDRGRNPDEVVANALKDQKIQNAWHAMIRRFLNALDSKRLRWEMHSMHVYQVRGTDRLFRTDVFRCPALTWHPAPWHAMSSAGVDKAVRQ